MKLTKSEDRVLRFLYDHKDDADEGSTSVARIANGTGLDEAAVKKALRRLKENRMVGGPPDLLDHASDVLKKLDSDTKPTDPRYAEMILMIAALLGKADEDWLADELGYDKEFVRIVGSRLRLSGIWQGNGLAEARLRSWENDSLSFHVDVLVATGELKVVGGTDANPQYQMTDAGLKTGAELIKRMSPPR